MAENVGEIHALDQSDWDRADASTGPPVDAEAAARAERSVADARYQAFASRGTGPDPCIHYDAPDHDFDRCIRETIPKPVLFAKQSTDADPIDPLDVRQAGLGDCDLHASLGALAGTPQGRALIRSAIVEKKDDKGKVVSWTVTLHEPEHHVFGSTTFRDVPITVDGPYVTGHANLRPDGSQNEVWPLVIEKAYAQYRGGYNKITQGGHPADVMTLLTGREAKYVSLDWPNRWFGGYAANQLQADLANGKMVVLSTRVDIGGRPSPDPTPAARQASLDAHRLVGDHAYFVTGTEQLNGKLFLKLGNPWGHAQPDLVPFDELPRWFSEVSVGSVP